ncbi:MAG: hypothetical protein ACPGJV_07405 [Bacteriovoracaceae bacterium]
MKKHSFGTKPKKIIWLQVAGLSSSHFAALKYVDGKTNTRVALESSQCVGKIWNYNLFKIRPSAKDQMLSQVTGTKNIEKGCPKSQKVFVDKSLGDLGYELGQYRFGDESFASCERFDSSVLWMSRSRKEKNSLEFHYQEMGSFKLGETYNDKSCGAQGCFTDIAKNIDAIQSSYFKGKNYYFFNIQIYEYEKLLKEKNFEKALELLQQINQAISNLIKKEGEDTLVLVSTTSPIDLVFPKQGQEWSKVNSSIRRSKSNLSGEVFAFGASSEKFCGVYDSNEISHRLLHNFNL